MNDNQNNMTLLEKHRNKAYEKLVLLTEKYKKFFNTFKKEKKVKTYVNVVL